MRRAMAAPPGDLTDQVAGHTVSSDHSVESAMGNQGSGQSRSLRSEAPVSLRTEFLFELPRGYVDEYGQHHTQGCMRLATARDELYPLRDPRVRENPAYLTVILLSRVVTRIGGITEITTHLIESLFAADVAFLQDLYRRINVEGHTRVAVACPECDHHFEVDVVGGRLGEL